MIPDSSSSLKFSNHATVAMLPVLQIHQGFVRAAILQVLFASFSQILCGVYKNATNIDGEQIA